MRAVILAGGLGTRLRPFTEVIPKPLLPLGERSLLEVQIERLREHGIDEVVLAINYRSEYIQAFLGDGSRYGVTLIYSRECTPLGTCGPLALLRDLLDEPFLVMNGDILTKLDFRRFCDFGAARASLVTVATKIISTPFRFGSVEADAAGHIVRLEEKPALTLEILAGIYYMRPDVLAWIPDGEYFGMDTLLTRMVAARQPVSRWVVQDYWLDIGQVEDYTQARQAYRENFLAEVAARLA